MGKFDNLLDGLAEDEGEVITKDDDQEKEKEKEKEKDGEDQGDVTKDEGENKEKGKEEEVKKDEGKEKKDDVTDDDFFSEEKKVDDQPKDDEGKVTKPSFKELAKKFEVDLEDDNEDVFFDKLNEKLQKAKQEVDVSNFSPDAQLIIKHLNEHDGKIEDLLLNKNIIQLNSIIDMEPEEKIRAVRINELLGTGLSESEAEEKVNKELEGLSTRELKNNAETIDQKAKGLIDQEIKTIISDREKAVLKKKESETATIEKEKSNLKSYITQQKEFLGLPLSDKAKKVIISDLEQGTFDTVTNADPVQSKFIAYMMRKYGDKIRQKIDSTMSDKNREGYNAGLDKSVQVLHDTKDTAKTKTTGHQQSKSTGDKKNFETWSDDLFSEGE